MPSTPEQREKWKEQHRLRTIKKRMERGEKVPEAERQALGNNLRATMTKTFKENLSREWSISVDVNWQRLPMPEAQTAYAELRKEFEEAGRIMNERSMPTPGSYTCFICKKTHAGDPRGTDYSYINPETGLMEPILICGELCWLRYQEFRIGKRREAQMPRSA